MKFHTSLLSAAFLAGCLITTGCSSLNVLQAVVDSTAAAVPILEANGVAVPPQVPVYIAAVANCIGSQPATPTPEEIAAISACFAKQIVPTLQPGVPSAVVQIVALVAQDVVNYLQQNPAPVTSAVAARKIPASLSAGDLAKLQAMREKAAATVAALRK